MSSKLNVEYQSQAARKVSLRFKPLQVKPLQTVSIGLVLLDESLKPIWCNSEALNILAYPNRPTKTTIEEFSKSIHSIVGETAGADAFVKTFNFVSGRRRYLCRIFMPGIDSGCTFDPFVAITLERASGVDSRHENPA